MPADQLKVAIGSVHPLATIIIKLRQYDNTLAIRTKIGKQMQVSKFKIAKKMTDSNSADLNALDLKV